MLRCGYRTGLVNDTSCTNWQNNGARPIAWSAWYPTDDVKDLEHPTENFFELGDVISNATLKSGSKFRVALLSHGTGGTVESMGWLARALACKGYIVVGANHHGNTGLEPFLAEGFLCWWERATDLSKLLTSLQKTGFFANRFDLNQVVAIGFSLGGYTVMALAGAQTSLIEFEAWRRENNITEGGPKEFPDAAHSIPKLIETSEAFRNSWERHGNDFTDNQIKSIIAIAPSPPVRSFIPKSVSQLQLPVTILTGSSDVEAPSTHCSDWLMEQNKRFQHHDLGDNVGHYTIHFWNTPLINHLSGNSIFFRIMRISTAQMYISKRQS